MQLKTYSSTTFGGSLSHHNSMKPANWFMEYKESPFNLMSGEYRMGQKEYAYTIMEFKKIKIFKKSEGKKRPTGRPRCRWKEHKN